MRLLSTLFLSAALWGLAEIKAGDAPPAKAVKSVPLVVEGDTVTVVKSYPFIVTAAPGAHFYVWSVPEGFTVTKAQNVLKVQTGPKSGTFKFNVTSAKIDFDNKNVATDEGEINVVIGAPTPPKPPDPPGPVNPVVKGWVVIIEETVDLAESRGRLFANADLSAYLNAKKWSLRTADKDARDSEGNVPKDLKPFIDRATGKGYPQLYVVDQDGGVRHEGALPKEPADILAILKKIGG